MAPIKTFCRCDVLYENVLICDLCRQNTTLDTVGGSPLNQVYFCYKDCLSAGKNDTLIRGYLPQDFSNRGKEENKCITTELVATLVEKPVRMLLSMLLTQTLNAGFLVCRS